jgi:hypothetical protein
LQVHVILGASFSFQSALSDGSDLRVTGGDGMTLIPFWIESWNATAQNASIWVSVPSIPVGGTQIYLYYGNPNPTIPQQTAVDVPPSGPFTKALANPIVPIGDPGGGTNLLAENIVFDSATGHYWMVFSNYRDGSIGIIWSDNPSNPNSWNWSNPIGSGQAPHLIQYQGLWYLFYADGNPHSINVRVSSSVNGPYQTPSPNPNPLLVAGRGWEAARVDEPFVFQRDDGKWIMMYMGDAGNTTEQIGYAIANNITGPYAKYSGNPVLAYTPGAYDGGTIADPWVVRFQQPGTSQVTYYIGYAASPANYSPWQTALATTVDWQVFTKQGILLPLSTNGWDSTNSFRGAALRVGNTYVLAYTGDGYKMGIATQPAQAIPPSPINNPEAVFDFYDAFSGSTLNSTKWSWYLMGSGSVSVSNGIATISVPSGASNMVELLGSKVFGANTVIEMMVRHNTADGSGTRSGEVGFGDAGLNNIIHILDYASSSFLKGTAANGVNGGNFIPMNAPLDATNFHLHTVFWNSGLAGFAMDQSPTEFISNSVPSVHLAPWLLVSSQPNTSTIQARWVRVRKWFGSDATTQLGQQEFTGPPSLASVTMNPNYVIGATTATGTASLTAPAQAAGVIINLSSTNSSVATPPPTVTVTSGNLSSSFTVTTSSVSTTTQVSISGSYNGIIKQAALTVAPAPVLSSLAMNPTSVSGGSVSTGTVTLSVAAPAPGVLVSLVSNNSAVVVPASVQVPAGSTTATFTATTNPVNSLTSVTVSASYNSVIKTATITVQPPALSSLSLSPSSVSAGSSSIGTVTLTGPAPAGFTVSLSSSNTSVATVPSSVPVPAGSASATFTVSTNPNWTAASVGISGTYGGSTLTFNLTITPLGWFNSAWKYRNSISVSNPCPSTCVNLQINIVLGNNFDFTKTLTNGTDIRVTAGDGVTAIPFWIENWNSTGATASIWANVPSIPPGGTSIYLYYNNPNASSLPPAPATVFDFYDNFPGASLDMTKWTISTYGAAQSTANVSGGTLTISVPRDPYSFLELASQPTFGPGSLLEAMVRHVTADGSGATAGEVGFGDSGLNNLLRILDYDQPSFLMNATASGNGGGTFISMATPIDTSFHLHRVYWSATQAGFTLDQSPQQVITTNVPTSQISVWLLAFSHPNPATVQANWVRVRKWFGAEAVTQVGPPQTLP